MTTPTERQLSNYGIHPFAVTGYGGLKSGAYEVNTPEYGMVKVHNATHIDIPQEIIHQLGWCDLISFQMFDFDREIACSVQLDTYRADVRYVCVPRLRPADLMYTMAEHLTDHFIKYTDKREVDHREEHHYQAEPREREVAEPPDEYKRVEPV